MFEELFIAHKGIYLLNHSIGRPLKNARQQLNERFFEYWEHGAAEVWPNWLQQVDNFRQQLAVLLNGCSEDFCPQVNLSGALTKVIHSLPLRRTKHTLLLHADDFLSMGFVLDRATKLGYSTRMIPANRDPKDIRTWQEYLTEDIAVVLVTHVHSNTSALMPVSDITALARRRDIISIVDIAQSVGVVPIDLQEWQGDFVLGSCVKWLCGGPGAGFLWAHANIVTHCEPVDVGWFSHDDSFGFDINDFRYAEGVKRFWGGTPSVLPFALAANSIETLHGIGINTIRQHNLALIQNIIEQLDPACIRSPIDWAQRGGTLVVNFGQQQSAVENRLHKANVRFDSRTSGLRLSPHIYTSQSEIDRVIECLTP
ncbi:MAG: aminotransferase class V-fold PLP-dependent enzyme [Pseudomonadales bacterium]